MWQGTWDGKGNAQLSTRKDAECVRAYVCVRECVCVCVCVWQGTWDGK